MLLLGLLGCPWFSDADYAAIADHDGDGLAAAAFGGEDCNDQDAQVGAGPVVSYADDDGDGFGAGSAAPGCDVPPGRADNADDCDDADASVGAATPTYADADGDGYGTGAAVVSCSDPSAASQDGDCDDTSATVHPDAPEDCFGTEDLDCDGEVGGARCNAEALRPWIAGTDGAGQGGPQQFGTRLLGNLDVDGDGAGDLVASAPYGYAVYGFGAPDLVARGALTEGDAALWFESNCSLEGYGMARGDVTGDGLDDLLIGCPQAAVPSSVQVVALPAQDHVRSATTLLQSPYIGDWFGAAMAWRSTGGGRGELAVGAPVSDGSDGRAWMLETPLPEGTVSLADSVPATTGGVASHGDGYGLGLTMAWAGDVAILGDPQAVVDVAGVGWPGAVFLWQPTVGLDTLLTPASAPARYGIDDYEGFGSAIDVGDYDGDGTLDLLVGAYSANGQTYGAGAVYLFASVETLADWDDAYSADYSWLGDDRNRPGADRHEALLGVAAVFAGDMTGDGLTDLALGAPGADGPGHEADAGAVYVVPGGLGPGEYDVEAVSFAKYGGTEGLNVGWALAAMGDVDADGRDDLAVGVPGWVSAEGNEVGAVTMWWGAEL